MAGQQVVADRKSGAEQGLAHFQFDRRVRARLAGGKTSFDRLGVDHTTQPDRKLDEFANVGRAFTLVSIEQARVRSTEKNVAQFPGEISSIADAGAHTLPEEGRSLVRGVAGKQEAPLAPLFRDGGMEGVDSGTLDLGLVRRDPPRQQLPDLGRLREGLGVLVRMNCDLPTPAVSGTANISRRPSRVAMLDAIVAEIGTVAAEQGVDDEPALVKAEFVHSGANEAAHQRAGPVATDDISGANFRKLAGGEIFIAHANAVCALIQCEHVAPVAQLDLRPASQAVDQDVFEVGLVEPIAEMPAHWSEILRTRPIQDQTAFGIKEPHTRAQDDMRQDVVSQSDGLEDAHAFIVEMHCARQVISARFALQYQGPHA